MTKADKEIRVTIGLEVHAQLSTSSKLFCSCATKFGAPPNSQTCPVCLGLPGALPVLNKKAVEAAIKLGLATECRIAAESIFARKNYFYPDLPKGYQITQFDRPICEAGFLEIKNSGKKRKIFIERIHLEEDAGKSIHYEPFVPEDSTLIDLNRCGIPLLEIVTEPELRNPEEAVRLVRELQRIVRYLGIGNANLEEGSLRCDANISVSTADATRLSPKTEIKNLNSLKSLSRALTHEIEKQKRKILSGGKLISATVLWDEKEQVTRQMRSKETAPDYRYFPEPDLPPLRIASDLINRMKKQLPELPGKKAERFCKKFHLSESDAEILTQTVFRADLFERLVKETGNAELVSKWLLREFLRYEKILIAKKSGTWEFEIVELLKLVISKEIGLRGAKEAFAEFVVSGRSIGEIIEQKHMLRMADEQGLKKIIFKIISENPKELAEYRAGKKQLFHYFVGQIMQETAGSVDPELVNKILKKFLNAM